MSCPHGVLVAERAKLETVPARVLREEQSASPVRMAGHVVEGRALLVSTEVSPDFSAPSISTAAAVPPERLKRFELDDEAGAGRNDAAGRDLDRRQARPRR